MTALEPVWQGLLTDLARHVPVVWDAGPREAPAWLDGDSYHCPNSPPGGSDRRDAELRDGPARGDRGVALGKGTARQRARRGRRTWRSPPPRLEPTTTSWRPPLPTRICRCTSPTAGARSTTRDGQAAAALADILVHGLSQDRVRRLIALAPCRARRCPPCPRVGGTCCRKVRPSIRRCGGGRSSPRRGELAKPVEMVLMPVIDLLHRGPEAAEQAGDTCFPASPGRCGVAPSGARRQEPSNERSSSCGCPIPQTRPAASYGRRPPNSPPVHVLMRVCSASTPKPGRATRWRIRCCQRIWSRPRLLDVLPLAEADRRDFRTIGATTRQKVWCCPSPARRHGPAARPQPAAARRSGHLPAPRTRP